MAWCLVRVQLCPWHEVRAEAAGQPDPQASAAILCLCPTCETRGYLKACGKVKWQRAVVILVCVYLLHRCPQGKPQKQFQTQKQSAVHTGCSFLTLFFFF